MSRLSTQNIHIDSAWGSLPQAVKWIFILCCLFSVSSLCVFMPWYYLSLLVFGAGVAVVLFVKFEYGVYILLFLVPVSARIIGITVYSSWNPLIGLLPRPINQMPIFFPFILFSFFGLILAKSAKTRRFFVDPLGFSFCVLFFYAIVTLLWAPNIKHSLAQLGILASNLALYGIVFHSISGEKRHKGIMWCWIISGILQSIILFVPYFLKPASSFVNFEIFDGIYLNTNVLTGAVTGKGFIRRGTLLADPNESAMILNLFMAVAIGLFVEEKNRSGRKFLMAVIVILLSAVLLTMSRGGIGALLIMMIFFFAAFKKLRKHFFVLTLTFIVGAAIVSSAEFNALKAIFLRKDIPSRFSLALKATKKSGVPGMKERIEWWKEGFKRIKDKGFLGLGVGNTKYHMRIPHAHNIYLSFLFDFGFIGLGVLISLIIILFKRFLYVFTYHQSSYLQCMCVALMGGVLAIGVQGLVDGGYNTPILWLFWGMAAATLNLARNEIGRQKSLDIAVQ